MVWIKRNLIFVISAAVGIILTGYCGYKLFGAISATDAANEQYQSTVANLTAMQQKSPFPSRENIKVAQEDEGRIKEFLAEFKKGFSPFPEPPAKTDKGFRDYLVDSLARFRVGASNAEVQIPPDYGFGFTGLINKLNYAPSDITAWMHQLQEINAILEILDTAKINYLVSLCRVPVSADDTGSGDCLIQAAPVTNQWGVLTPYKITFRGFSTEIAAVLEGFARASNCFIVKSVDVIGDTTGNFNSAEQQQAAMPEPLSRPPMQAYQAAMPRRNQLFDREPRGIPGGRYAPPPPVAQPRAASQAAASASSEPPVLILTESPLTVTIAVDAVKLKTSEH